MCTMYICHNDISKLRQTANSRFFKGTIHFIHIDGARQNESGNCTKYKYFCHFRFKSEKFILQSEKNVSLQSLIYVY